MSNDKDFLQLVDDRIKIWNPTRRKIYGTAEVHSEYQVHPGNFVFFRALDGDNSDNISGIKGFGLKTVIKAFPMISESKKTNPQELYNYAQLNKNKLKVYSTFFGLFFSF